VREAKNSFFFSLEERPTFVRFDPGNWLLKELTFEKGREALLAQLRYDPDIVGRMRAAKELAKFLTHKSVLEALTERLETEPAWAVRRRIAKTLGESDDANTGEILADRLESEPKSDVRRALVEAMGKSDNEDGAAAQIAQRLRETIAQDPSYSVVAAALDALSELVKKDARPELVAALERPSFREAIRRAGIRELAAVEDLTDAERAELVRLFTPLTQPEHDSRVRGAAFLGLARVGKENDAVFRLLKDTLDTTIPWLRIQVIEAFGELGDERAVDVLTKRRRVEGIQGPARPREAIDRALRKLRGEPALEKLQQEFDRLEKNYKGLEERLKVIEDGKG
jgi:aminopeptidase N